MAHLVLGAISLVVFFNTLTADGKYPVQYCENLQLPIQMEAYDKRKTFSQFFLHFWNLHQILDILKKEMMVIANVVQKLRTVKNFVTQVCKKRSFGILLDSRHVKMPRILAKSP